MAARFNNWAKRFWIWLCEAKLVWLIVLWVAAILVYGTIYWCSEFSIRLTGYLYQIFGLLLAFKEIRKIADHFEQPHFKKLIFDWIKRFPRWKNNIVINAKGTVSANLGLRAYIEVWQIDDPELPVEERMNIINNNLELIRESLRIHSKAQDDLSDQVEAKTKELSHRAQLIESEIKSNLKELHTSDLLMSLLGLMLLAIGISISTFSKELALIFCVNRNTYTQFNCHKATIVQC